MNKPTAFITRSSRLSKTRTRSADQLTPRMYYAWVEYNGKEFEVGRYMTRYGALRGAVRYARDLFVHERKHNKEREAVDAADIQGLPLPYFLRCQEAIRDVEDAADIQGLPYVEDGETKFSFLDTLKLAMKDDGETCFILDELDPPCAIVAGGKSQYVSGLQKLDDGELMY